MFKIFLRKGFLCYARADTLRTFLQVTHFLMHYILFCITLWLLRCVLFYTLRFCSIARAFLSKPVACTIHPITHKTLSAEIASAICHKIGT